MVKSLRRCILQAQYPIRQKGQDKCPSHRENSLLFLCQDCKTLICSNCTLTSHKNHINSFIEISKIEKSKRRELQDFVNDIDNTMIQKCKEEIKLAREELSSCHPKQNHMYEDIKKQRDKCKKEIDKIAEDHLAKCDKMEKVTTDLLQTLSSESKQTLQTGTAVLVYDSVSEIQDLDLNIPQTPNIDMTDFTPGTDRRNHLEQAMGKMKTPTDQLQAGSAPSGHSKQGPVVRSKQSKSTETGQVSTGAVLYKFCDSPTVIAQFSYNDDISSICPTPDGRAWLCDYDTDTVNLINNKGQVLQKIQHNSNIEDISLDPATGRLWFCCGDDRTIYEVSTSSTPVRRFTTEDDPACLCVTREGRVVVGTLGIQGYKVVMYTVDGRVLHTATAEESGTGLVRSITQCGVTGNIAVVSCKHISGDSSDINTYRRHIIVYNDNVI